MGRLWTVEYRLRQPESLLVRILCRGLTLFPVAEGVVDLPADPLKATELLTIGIRNQ